MLLIPMAGVLWFVALATPACTDARMSFANRRCKPLPGSADWPSLDSWSSLNASIDGRLSPASPPGAVCHPTQTAYDPSACNATASQWNNSSFHASNPWSLIYNDNTCEPNATLPCSAAGYPAYAVIAQTAADVQQAVNFARETGVRLVIKGTGHDYLGRSSGPGTLELWTHQLRGVEFASNDSYAIAQGGIGAAKIASGMRWSEVYKEAVKHNVTVIGGADPDVGIGGWTLHGGHSPISSLYGLGVDQVLDMEVVTADGVHRVINETSDSDLFWALRGGGAGTFAVLLLMRVKSYPSLPGTIYHTLFNTTENSDTFWSLAAHFSAKMPGFSEAGGMGYYFIYPYNGNPDPASSGFVVATFIFPNKNEEEVQEIMLPFTESLVNAPWAEDQIYSQNDTLPFSNFLDYWVTTNPAGPAGHNTRLGSWLLGDSGLNGDIDQLKAALKLATDPTYGSIGHVVAGPGVRDAKIVGGSNAVLPAWRNAYVHFVAIRRWDDFNLTQKASATVDMRDTAMPAVRALQPQSGAYMNEADPTNPLWQHDYFGDTYPRLMEVKQLWDPDGVFYCRPCIGSELWEIIDGPGNQPQIEWGVGQTAGRVCRRG